MEPDGVSLLYGTGSDTANGDAAHVIIPVNIGNEHLELPFRVGVLRCRDMFHNLEQEGRAVHGRFPFHGIHEIAVAGGAVHEGGFKLFVRSAQLQEQFQHLVMHGGGIGVRTVDLVNHHDRHQSFLESLAKHEARLGLRPFKSIHHQKNAVHHLHHAFYFTAEIGMSRSINDVDGVSVPEDGSVLRLDRDAFFTFQIHGIHGAFLHGLVGPVGAARLQKLVNQGGFPMVNVSDDGEIAELGRI